MATVVPHYRDYLKEAIQRWMSRNPRLTLRAAAKRLHVSHATLSQVLRGGRNLTRETARKISEGLSFSALETEQFLTLVELDTTRDSRYREHLREKARALWMNPKIEVLSPAQFEGLGDWYFSALIELTRVMESRLTPELAAQALGISRFEAQLALDRLIDRGILTLSETETGYKKNTGVLETSSPTPSSEIRRHHRQMAEKARDAIDAQTIDRRYFTDMTIAVDRNALPEVAQRIEKFKTELSRFLNAKRTLNAVYQINFQIFELTDRVESVKKNKKQEKQI